MIRGRCGADQARGGESGTPCGKRHCLKAKDLYAVGRGICGKVPSTNEVKYALASEVMHPRFSHAGAKDKMFLRQLSLIGLFESSPSGCAKA